MKILWVSPDFLHPPTRGGQIRSLQMLRCLHRRHEIHFIALDRGGSSEGLARSDEYCSSAIPVPHFVPEKLSLGFGWQLFAGVFSSMPVAVSRYCSSRMRARIAGLLSREKFDSLVCDFLFSAPNIPDLSRAVLFQHNVETVIWRRRVEHATDSIRRAYLASQAGRMAAFEGDVCRRAGRVVAVSEIDASTMRQEYGVSSLSSIATGVDLDYFAPPPSCPPVADLVFVGSMDWIPNVDAVEYFVLQILPRIRAARPGATVAVVGRKPSAAVRRLADRDNLLHITGTVDDIRPYLWGARVSVVPLRIGGGTRLKIYESMAAQTAVVSTRVGAEGLPLEPGRHLAIADDPEQFAAQCLRLLDDVEERLRMAREAHRLVASRFSWDAVAAEFEEILQAGPRPC